MAIDYHDVFPILADAIPGFAATESDWEEPLPYVFMFQMVVFVCSKNSDVEVDSFVALCEHLLTEGDDETRYLAMDAVENLADEPEGPIVALRLGPKGQEIWKTYYRPKPTA